MARLGRSLARGLIWWAPVWVYCRFVGIDFQDWWIIGALFISGLMAVIADDLVKEPKV